MELIEKIVVTVCMIAYIIITTAIIHKPKQLSDYLKGIGMNFNLIMVLFAIWISILLIVYMSGVR